MAKFYDGKEVVEIRMVDGNSGMDFEDDFFDVGRLKYNEALEAYIVDDIYYLIDYAQSYADGSNTDIDYAVDDDGKVILPEVDVFVSEVEEP
jgi:hypothetical protein